ncbi:hypothetical protein NPIL_444911, partial [Nephila pilipes]
RIPFIIQSWNSAPAKTTFSMATPPPTSLQKQTAATAALPAPPSRFTFLP